MKRGFVSAFIILGLTGAGCFRSPSPSGRAVIPEVRIESPANGSETAAATINIVGRSNMPEVTVAGNAHLVINGIFSVPIELHPGSNDIAVMAENGYTTTTLRLNVMRSETSSTQP